MVYVKRLRHKIFGLPGFRRVGYYELQGQKDRF